MIRASGELVAEGVSPEAAFDYVADLENEPTFNPDASDIRRTTPGEIGLGTIYTEDVKPLGRFEVTIDAYDRPNLLGFDARNPRAHIVVRFRFEPANGGTRVSAEMEFEPRGVLRLAEPALRPMLRRMYDRKRAPMLKRALEDHARLDSGRAPS